MTFVLTVSEEEHGLFWSLLKPITMQKPNILSYRLAKQIDFEDMLRGVRFNYLFNYKTPNFAINSLGPPHRNAPLYVHRFMKHWQKNQVQGHMIPMYGIGKNPTGYANFRNMFYKFAKRIVGARTIREVTVLNDQSANYCSLLSFLLRKQMRKGRNIVLYEKSGAFPSDAFAIKETVKIFNQGIKNKREKLILVPVPQTKYGLIDHKKLLTLIQKIGKKLAVAAFGSGGIHWKTAQLLDMEQIGPAVKKVGGKTLVNIAHALGIVELKLHQWQITAAVGCGYKFLSAGPGGPSIVFIHESERTDTLLPVGWFSYENPIAALQGIYSPIKKGVHRMEASNPMVLGWLAFLAALEEYYKHNPATLRKKRNSLLSHFDTLLAEIQTNFNSPIELITPQHERSTEIIFTTKDKKVAKQLHAFLNKGRGKVICDIRDGSRIRVGMFPLITSHEDISVLFNKMWNFFAQK